MGYNKSINFILVKPIHPGNVGSSLRAILNMGFENLTIVGGRDIHKQSDAYKMAACARSRLDSIHYCDTLQEAVDDASLVVGTTARIGFKRSRVTLGPIDLQKTLHSFPEAKWAFLFGPEDAGLDNSHLECCHYLLHIPTNPDFSSLNLAQAVLITAFQVRNALETDLESQEKDLDTGMYRSENTNKVRRVAQERLPALQAEQQRTMEQVQQLLQKADFFGGRNPVHVINQVHNFLGRCQVSSRELKILRGMVHRLDIFVRAGREKIKGGN